MKLFIVILLLGVSSVAHAYKVFDLRELLENPPVFAKDEQFLTWGEDNRLGEAAFISYSFVETELAFMPDGYQNMIIDAFNAWESVSNVSFNFLNNQVGDITIRSWALLTQEYGFNVLAIGGVLVPDPLPIKEGVSYSYIEKGIVVFDNAENWSLDSSGISVFSVALHEIGHALGLDHSLDETAVMYKYYGAKTSLQADDIAGIQYLYGASTVSPVPEPSTCLMFLLGLAMMAGVGRRAVNRS